MFTRFCKFLSEAEFRRDVFSRLFHKNNPALFLEKRQCNSEHVFTKVLIRKSYAFLPSNQLTFSGWVGVIQEERI